MNGLGATKLDLHATQQYLSSFHVIILTETQSPRADTMPEYDRHEIPAGRPGARGEGICVLVHPDIVHGVCLWRSVPSAALLWLVLKVDITGFSDDVYLGAVYVPPAQSALLHAVSASDRFAALTESAFAASALGRVLLLDVFNARVAIKHDELATSLQALGLPVDRTLGLKAMAGICCSFAFQLALSLALVGCRATAMQPFRTHMQQEDLALITCCWILDWCLIYCGQKLMTAATSLTIAPGSPPSSVNVLLNQTLPDPQMVVTPCPGLLGIPAIARTMLMRWMAWL